MKNLLVLMAILLSTSSMARPEFRPPNIDPALIREAQQVVKESATKFNYWLDSEFDRLGHEAEIYIKLEGRRLEKERLQMEEEYRRSNEELLKVMSSIGSDLLDVTSSFMWKTGVYRTSYAIRVCLKEFDKKIEEYLLNEPNFDTLSEEQQLDVFNNAKDKLNPEKRCEEFTSDFEANFNLEDGQDV